MERGFIILVAVSTVFVAWFVSSRPATIDTEEPQTSVADEPQVSVTDEPQLVFPNIVPNMPRAATKTVPKDRSSKSPVSSKTTTPKATVPTASVPLRWTLPVSCANVKWYSAHFTAAHLETMRQSAGIAAPTADQRAQVQACLAGKIK